MNLTQERLIEALRKVAESLFDEYGEKTTALVAVNLLAAELSPPKTEAKSEWPKFVGRKECGGYYRWESETDGKWLDKHGVHWPRESHLTTHSICIASSETEPITREEALARIKPEAPEGYEVGEFRVPTVTDIYFAFDNEHIYHGSVSLPEDNLLRRNGDKRWILNPEVCKECGQIGHNPSQEQAVSLSAKVCSCDGLCPICLAAQLAKAKEANLRLAMAIDNTIERIRQTRPHSLVITNLEAALKEADLATLSTRSAAEAAKEK